MNNPGRAIAIAELIRGHGPRMAAQIVADANRKHRELNPGGCASSACPVCGAPRETRAPSEEA